jgi:hypothetical protein
MGYSKFSKLCYQRTDSFSDEKDKMDFMNDTVRGSWTENEPWVRNRGQYLILDMAVTVCAWYSHHSHRKKRPNVFPVQKNGFVVWSHSS